MSLLDTMSQHPHVRLRSQDNGLIACNFTRDAFQRGCWDATTLHARGLFLDEAGTIIGRGYEKFFNLGETHGYDLDAVEREFEGPVTVAEKLNGFLGILFAYRGELLLWSKGGETLFSRAATTWLHEHTTAAQRQRAHDLLVTAGCSVTLEVCLPNDPHIVAQPEGMTVLDALALEGAQRFVPQVAAEVAHALDLPYVHARDMILPSAASVRGRLDQYRLATDLEGLVIRDAVGRATKIKLPYYQVVKSSRAALGRRLRGKRGGFWPWAWLEQQATAELLRAHTVSSIAGGDIVHIPKLMEALGAQEQWQQDAEQFIYHPKWSWA